jgi:hypothetical protein
MKPTDRNIREALSFFSLSRAERISFTKKHVGPTDPRPWLDLDVRHELAARKYTSFKMLPEGQDAQPGDITAKNGEGRIFVGEITSLGKMWLEMGRN